MIQKIRYWIRNEDGVAMTEFVITLPVFILIFTGIVNLHKLEWNNNRVKYLAATEMWDNAMAIHDTNLIGMLPFEHSIPMYSAAMELSEIGSHQSPQGDIQAMQIAFGLFDGSKGEAEAAGGFADGDSTAYEYGADFSEDMTDDSSINPLSFSGKTAMMAFNVAVPFTYMGTRHASALGTRYGIVTGENSRTVSIPGHTGNFNYGYDVLVSPTSVPGGFLNELIVVGHSRLAAEDSPCLSSVLKISNDGDYDC